MHQNLYSRPITSLKFPERRFSLQTFQTLTNQFNQKFLKINQTELINRNNFQNVASQTFLSNATILKPIDNENKINEEQFRKTIELKKTMMKTYISLAVERNLSEKKKNTSPLRKSFSPFEQLHSHRIQHSVKFSTPSQKIQKKIQKYIKERQQKQIKIVEPNLERQSKMIETKIERRTPPLISNINFNKPKNNFNFLKKGYDTTKKILTTILKKKITKTPDIEYPYYLENEQIAKEYHKIIPVSYQDVIGKSQVVRMAKIFKGIQTKQVEVYTPLFKKRQQYQINPILEQQEYKNKITGWQLEEQK